MKLLSVRTSYAHNWRGGVTLTVLAVAVPLAACTGGSDSDAAASEFGDPDFSVQSADSAVHVTATVRLTGELISLGGEGGVSVDGNGTIYVSNFNTSVWSVSPTGEVALLNDEFTAASGNTVLSNGDLLQADFRENKVVKIGGDGEVREFSADGLNGPVGLARGPTGAVYVANCLGKYVARIDPGGGPAQRFAADERFGCPNGIVSDGAGNLFLADLNTPVLFKITPEGVVSEHADLGGPGNGHVAMVGETMYVTQLRIHQVVRLNSDGSQQVVAGTGERGFANGPEGTSTVSFPNGVAVDPAGTMLYFNTHRGIMQGGNRGSMIIRVLYLPTG